MVLICQNIMASIAVVFLIVMFIFFIFWAIAENKHAEKFRKILCNYYVSQTAVNRLELEREGIDYVE